MNWLTIVPMVASLFRLSPKITDWINTGVSVVDELQKEDPKLVPILRDIGVKLFPKLEGTINVGANAVQAALDVIMFPGDTKWVQSSLNKLGAKLTVDGDYGPLTKAAVEVFQKAHQPASGPVDGWAGKLTITAMQIELAKIK